MSLMDLWNSMHFFARSIVILMVLTSLISWTIAVLKSLFRPGRVYGRAVRVLVAIPIDFKIGRNR